MRGWKKYMENEVKTSNPAKITMMAYEKCILELKFSKEKMLAYKYSEVEPSLEKVEKIIHELSLQLNYDVFPELANDLFDLYAWILDQITLLKMRKDATKVDPVINVIQNLLDGYREALKNE